MREQTRCEIESGDRKEKNVFISPSGIRFACEYSIYGKLNRIEILSMPINSRLEGINILSI